MAFIGAGTPTCSIAALRPSDVYLLAVPDDQIAACCDALAATGILHEPNIVFHCSGALVSSVLNSAVKRGASVASIHPIRSFAIPAQVVEHFAGTYCGVEGDAPALAIMRQAFADIGAEWVVIDGAAKVLYHAAAVIASNYLVTLLDVAQQAYVKAGVADDVALKLMAPLVRETLENVLRIGPGKALTGPVARGDLKTVELQSKAVHAWDARDGAMYDVMASLTASLAARSRPRVS